jgi:surface protein
MSHIILALLQRVLISDLAKIVYAFVPDIECHYADKSTQCFKNGDIVDFSDVVHIIVFTEFIITKDARFRLLVDITGPVKLVGDMSGKFEGCESFNSNTDLWDTSNCTTMRCMFLGCKLFNQPLHFNTSNCTNMAYMFYECKLFNQPLRFNTSNCTNMTNMFYGCESFNQPLKSFDTSNCTSMRYMFYGCISFNHSLRSFDTANCTDMSYMFSDCLLFDQPLNNFDTSKCTNMRRMFSWCELFNQTLYFDMSNCDNRFGMLSGCCSTAKVIHIVRIITIYRRYENAIVSAITDIVSAIKDFILNKLF